MVIRHEKTHLHDERFGHRSITRIAVRAKHRIGAQHGAKSIRCPQAST